MNDFYRLLRKMKEKTKTRFAMATVIDVDGSAYRHPGAKMLICEHGKTYGTISAGCLEEDLFYHAQEVIHRRQPKTLTYDLRSEDDLSWGQGAGCNGSIKIYVEPCEWTYKPQFHHEPVWPQAESLLESGNTVVSVKSISQDPDGGFQIIYANQEAVLGDRIKPFAEMLLPEVGKFIESGRKIKLLRLPEIGPDLLFELLEPREKLYIFGAGPDVEPVARLAYQSDFYVTIIDPRGDLRREEQFPTVDQFIVEHSETYFKNTAIDDKSYVLVMTHSFQRDQYILRNLMQAPPYYLGVLGPRRRTERLAMPDPLPEYIFSPIGLNIGAEGPEEISISIMAELLKVRNKTRGKQNRKVASLAPPIYGTYN